MEMLDTILTRTYGLNVYERLVEKLKQLVKPGQEMVNTALRYVISNPAVSTVIPGAKSPAQAATNAQAGAAKLSVAEIDKLVATIDG